MEAYYNLNKMIEAYYCMPYVPRSVLQIFLYAQADLVRCYIITLYVICKWFPINQMCQSLFFNKIVGLRPATLLKK